MVVWIDPYRFASGGASFDDYVTLVTSQGATNLWGLQAAASTSGTESDLIGSDDMVRQVCDSSQVPGPSSVIPYGIDNEDPSPTTQYGSYRGGGTSVDTSWSVTMWTNVPASRNLGTSNVLFRMVNGSSRDYMFLIHRDDKSGLSMQANVNPNGFGAVYVNTGVDLDDLTNEGTWHHIAVTRDYSATAADDTITIWIDGSVAASATRASVNWDTAFSVDEFVIGAQTDASDSPWPGHIAAVAYFDGTVLSSAQINAQYDLGIGA